MAKLFLKRLEDALNSFDEDEVNLTLVASRIITKYYEEEKDVMKTIDKMREVDVEINDDRIGIWTLLCSQTLMLQFAKSSKDKDVVKEIAKGINETLGRFDNIEDYRMDESKVEN
tara:strand:- start:606 stop:950 length:345 start_codon:yes stop_codon:yes gene_type:complete